jgi:hypothetical protein
MNPYLGWISVLFTEPIKKIPLSMQLKWNDEMISAGFF